MVGVVGNGEETRLSSAAEEPLMYSSLVRGVRNLVERKRGCGYVVKIAWMNPAMNIALILTPGERLELFKLFTKAFLGIHCTPYMNIPIALGTLSP